MALLKVLVGKENGRILNIPPCVAADASDFDWLLHGSSCGGKVIPMDVKGGLLKEAKPRASKARSSYIIHDKLYIKCI